MGSGGQEERRVVAVMLAMVVVGGGGADGGGGEPERDETRGEPREREEERAEVFCPTRTLL